MFLWSLRCDGYYQCLHLQSTKKLFEHGHSNCPPYSRLDFQTEIITSTDSELVSTFIYGYFFLFGSDFNSSDSSSDGDDDDAASSLANTSVQQEYGGTSAVLFELTFAGVVLQDHDVCLFHTEYRPLLPYSESTSQILLSSLNPVDNRQWRRKSRSWRVFKVLKVGINLVSVLL